MDLSENNILTLVNNYLILSLSDTPSPFVTMETDEEVEMQVRPHPKDISVAGCPIRNLSTAPATTVAHIIKYITDYPPPADKKGNKIEPRSIT